MKTRNEFTQVENDHIAAEDRLRKEQDLSEWLQAIDRAYPAKVEPRSEAYRLCASVKVNPHKKYVNGTNAEDLAELFLKASKFQLKGMYHLQPDQAEDAEKIGGKLGASFFKSPLLFPCSFMYHDLLLNYCIVIITA